MRMKNTPELLVFVRHGRTLANDVYSARRKEHPYDLEDEAVLQASAEWKHALNPTGVEQMERARKWIDAELGGLATFDALYTSYYVRARQSAALLGNGRSGWRIDDRLAEQHHGIFGMTDYDKRDELHPETTLLRTLSPWYVGYPGGENRSQMRERYRSFEQDLGQVEGISSALIVAHTGLINTARYHIESLLPEEQEELEALEVRPIRNGSILAYSKINPFDNAERADEYAWRRQFYPSHDGSPDNGEWTQFDGDRVFSAEDLAAQVQTIIE
jgi:broad specificity phosphatase PhoE